MQTIRVTFLSLALTFGGASLALAQSPTQPAQQPQLMSDGTTAPAQTLAPAATPRRTPNPNKQTRKLSKELGLTAAQSAQIEPILADRDTRVTALRSDTTVDPRTMHKQNHAIELETQAKINAVLTPSQQQLYADVRAAHKNHGAPAAAPAPVPNA